MVGKGKSTVGLRKKSVGNVPQQTAAVGTFHLLAPILCPMKRKRQDTHEFLPKLMRKGKKGNYISRRKKRRERKGREKGAK